MNSEFFTDEFRNFKYLKSTARQNNYYKATELLLNSIQPQDQEYSSDFHWKYRVEFFEQLIDLQSDTVWLIEPGSLYAVGSNSYDWEEASITELKNPVITEGHPLHPNDSRIATIDDIPELENDTHHPRYFLCTGNWEDIGMGFDDKLRVLSLYKFCLIPGDLPTYPALFYNKEWAIKYQRAVTAHLRKNNDAISAISKLI